MKDAVANQLFVAIDQQRHACRRVMRELKAARAEFATAAAKVEAAEQKLARGLDRLTTRETQLRQRPDDPSVYVRPYGRPQIFHASANCSRIRRSDGRGVEVYEIRLLGDALEAGLELCGTWECRAAARSWVATTADQTVRGLTLAG